MNFLVNLRLFSAFITLYINFNVLLPCLADQYMNPDWVDPHAWSKERDPLIQLCPESQPCKPCESNAQAPYLRLVNTIFDINKLHVSIHLFKKAVILHHFLVFTFRVFSLNSLMSQQVTFIVQFTSISPKNNYRSFAKQKTSIVLMVLWQKYLRKLISVQRNWLRNLQLIWHLFFCNVSTNYRIPYSLPYPAVVFYIILLLL